jgi:hypothetical protein
MTKRLGKKEAQKIYGGKVMDKQQFVTFLDTKLGQIRKGYLTVVQPPEGFSVPKVIFSDTELSEAEINSALDTMAKQNAKQLVKSMKKARSARKSHK